MFEFAKEVAKGVVVALIVDFVKYLVIEAVNALRIAFAANYAP